MELKFRAWDRKLNRWLNGREIDSRLTFNSVAFPKVGYEFWIEDSGHFAIGQEIELVRYTGLKDKNRVESYWDDIVNDGINPPFAITPDYHLLARLSEIEFEVIGNLWENPELLKSELTNRESLYRSLGCGQHLEAGK